MCRKGPRYRTAEKSNDLATFHCRPNVSGGILATSITLLEVPTLQLVDVRFESLAAIGTTLDDTPAAVVANNFSDR